MVLKGPTRALHVYCVVTLLNSLHNWPSVKSLSEFSEFTTQLHVQCGIPGRKVEGVVWFGQLFVVYYNG